MPYIFKAPSSDFKRSKKCERNIHVQFLLKRAETLVRCANCNTTVTPLWRRNANGEKVCNRLDSLNSFN